MVLPTITRRQLLSSVTAIFFVSLSIFGALNMPQTARALIGSGGNPSGGAGGAQTKYGWGWYNFSVDGNPQPLGFKDGNTWANVSSQCRAAGADRVIAFLIETVPGSSNAAQAIVYQYRSTYDPFQGHRSGGDWLATSTAKAMYDSIGDSKVGFTWGQNVAWFCYADQTQWGVSSYTGIKKATTTSVYDDSGWGTSNITAVPGETLYWKHTLTATGARIDKDVSWGLRGSGFPAGFPLTNSGGTVPASSSIQNGQTFVQLGSYPGANPSYTIYTVTNSDVGNTLCQHIDWSPAAWNNGGTGSSTQVCASVPYSYSLTPSISIPQSEVEVGSTINVQPTITNSGPTQSAGTNWQISYITAPSGVGLPAAINNSSLPCVYYQGAGRTCTVAAFVSGGAAVGSGDVFNVGTDNFALRQAITADLPVGTQVCYALSVQPRSSDSGQWAHSAPTCVVVSKRPVVRVMGSDLIVGRGLSIGSIVNTNVKTIGGIRYGAWGEYGIEASGLISGMASASGYAGGVTASTLCAVSNLSFSNHIGTNSCVDNKIGQYTFKAAVSTVAGRFPASAGTVISGDQSVVGLTSGKTYTNDASGSEIRLTAKNNDKLGAGQWVVINAPGATVKIMNNLVYTNGALTSISQIPQLVIIAKNIVIADSVSQVDAWLVATGTGTEGRVNTCGAGAVTEVTTLTSALCNTPLTVNGPVIANHLLLRRTAGAGVGAASGDPAEVFNLRPDAYLWATNLQSSTTKVQTVRTTELPPRY